MDRLRQEVPGIQFSARKNSRCEVGTLMLFVERYPPKRVENDQERSAPETYSTTLAHRSVSVMFLKIWSGQQLRRKLTNDRVDSERFRQSNVT